jgi:hypothetical protein
MPGTLISPMKREPSDTEAGKRDKIIPMEALISLDKDLDFIVSYDGKPLEYFVLFNQQ